MLSSTSQRKGTARMNLRLLVKIGAIFLVALSLLLPVATVRELVRERAQTRDAVVAEIARSTGYAQTLVGPLLVVPYTRKVRTLTEGREGEPRRLIETETPGQLTILPARFELEADLDVSERQRGIYRARIFDAQSRITGAFELMPHYGVTADVDDYTFGAPRLVLGVSDPRGIGNALELSWDEAPVPFEPGTSTALLPSGVHAVLPVPDLSSGAQRVDYALSLTVQGTGELQVTPMGRESHVRLSSNWPHPSFVGELSPRDREIGPDGFSARWQTSFFATNLENVVSACRDAGPDQPCSELGRRHFGVSFVDPVDHYLQSDRATKYAFLFIGLTFAACFVLEVLRRLRVHPIQYCLVGSALAVFFLLLLSLAEHLGFPLAYCVSAVACVALITHYVASALANTTLGLGFGAALGSLYALLYAILSAEDYALLIGALLVFATLGAFMIVTRRVNWSSFSDAAPPLASGTDPRA